MAVGAQSKDIKSITTRLVVHLVSQLVVRWGVELHFREREMRCIVYHTQRLEAVGSRVHNGGLASIEGSLCLCTQWLSVPVLKILNIWKSFAYNLKMMMEQHPVTSYIALWLHQCTLTFKGLCNKAGWLSLARFGVIESSAKSLDVVAIHNDSVESEGLHPCTIDVYIVLKSRRLALAETIDVDDSHQVIKLVVTGEGSCLPHTPLCTLSVPHDAIHTVAADIQEVELSVFMRDRKLRLAH